MIKLDIKCSQDFVDVKNIQNGDLMRKLCMFSALSRYIHDFTRYWTLHCSIWDSYTSRKLILSMFTNSGFGLVFDFTVPVLLTHTEIGFVKTNLNPIDMKLRLPFHGDPYIGFEFRLNISNHHDRDNF